MEYSDEYLRGQLPREDPPIELVPPDVTSELERYAERGDVDDRALVARSVRWTYAIFAELGLRQFQVVDSFVPWQFWVWGSHGHDLFGTTVGLFDPDREEKGFGLCLDMPGWGGPSFYIVAHLRFPRLAQTFPLAVRRTRTELHAAPNPLGATTACWGRCNATGNWGIVTAGHAIGTSLPGVSVMLDDGTTGLSHRSFWQPIDAAFVLTMAPSPAPAMLPVLNFPAAGVPVIVECRSGALNRTVAAACNSLGFFRTRSWPVLFFLDNPCAPGDSGALVRLSSGDAGGIYLGADPCPDTGGTSGRVLNFAQAMFALDATPYR